MEYFRYSLILMFGYVLGADGCVDQKSSCSDWASNKECFTNTAYIPCTCPVSCAVNTTCAGNVTEDQSCKCLLYGSSGDCETNTAISLLCPSTCSKRASITCPNDIPMVIPHGKVENSSLNSDGIYRFLHRIKYNCDYGYHHGNYLRPSYMCDKTGVWYWGYFNGNSSCKLVNCSTPPNVNYTTVTYLNTTFEEQATYSCQPGYTTVGGSAVKVCSLSNIWMGNDLICTEDEPLHVIKTFVPKVREAEGAVAFGVVGIIVIVAVIDGAVAFGMLVGIIVIAANIGGICALDLTSYKRHYALFRRNTRPFRKWVQRCFKKKQIAVMEYEMEPVSELKDLSTVSVILSGKCSMPGVSEEQNESQHGINNSVSKWRKQTISNGQKEKNIFDVANNPIQIEKSSASSKDMDNFTSSRGIDAKKQTKKRQSKTTNYQKTRQRQVNEGKSNLSTTKTYVD